MIRTLAIRALVDNKGRVTLEMPKELTNREVDLVVVYETVRESLEDDFAPPMAWPSDFVAATVGAWKGQPLVRESEGSYEVRDSLP